MDQRKGPGTAARASSTTPIDTAHHTVESQQVSWWSVREFVAAVLDQVNGWPMAGTPAWCSLAHDDPAKWAALLDAAQHHSLRVEACQEAAAQASHDIAEAADWDAVSREIRERQDFYSRRPWLRREGAA